MIDSSTLDQYSSATNKRKFYRLPRPFRVQAKELVFPIAKDPLIDSTCTDISKGGLCVESPLSLPLGTRLYISVHIPLLNRFKQSFYKVYENDTEQYFQTIADILWVRQHEDAYLMGLQFIDSDQESCDALGRLIDSAFKEHIAQQA